MRVLKGIKEGIEEDYVIGVRTNIVSRTSRMVPECSYLNNLRLRASSACLHDDLGVWELWDLP